MSKLLTKRYFKIIISVAVGFFLAGGYTDIAYTFPTIYTEQGGSGGGAFESAITHPRDLINNEQNSLTRFLKTFAISSLVSFALLSVYSHSQTKKKT